jgi:hypothetical protein
MCAEVAVSESVRRFLQKAYAAANKDEGNKLWEAFAADEMRGLPLHEQEMAARVFEDIFHELADE